MQILWIVGIALLVLGNLISVWRSRSRKRLEEWVNKRGAELLVDDDKTIHNDDAQKIEHDFAGGISKREIQSACRIKIREKDGTVRFAFVQVPMFGEPRELWEDAKPL